MGQLQDTSENVHLLSKDNGGVTTSSDGSFVVRAINLGPSHSVGTVKAPDIVEFAVVVLLTTKHVDFTPNNTNGNGCTGSWSRCHLLDFTAADVLSGELHALMLAIDNFVNTGAVNVSTEAHEGAVPKISTGMVIPAEIFDFCL